MTSGWRSSVADLADALARGLEQVAHTIETEQAIYGLDACSEVELHPIIARCLEDAGFGVHREQRYPSDRRKRKVSEGERCDLVLTESARPLIEPELHMLGKATLFDPIDAVDLDDAFWLEVKVIAQFTPEGPNRTYASQLLSTVRQDVTKLSKEPGILHAGLLLILFVREAAVANHDLGIWQDRCLQRGLPIGAPSIRQLPIADRLGNACCTVAVYPVSHL